MLTYLLNFLKKCVSDGLQMANELQNIFERFLRDNPNEIEDENLSQIPERLLHCVEVLYEFTPASQ